MEQGVESDVGILEDHVPGEDGGFEVSIAPAVGPDAGIEDVHIEGDAYLREIVLDSDSDSLLRCAHAAVEREVGGTCLLEQGLRLVGVVFDDRQRIVVARQVRVQVFRRRRSCTMKNRIDKLLTVDCVVDGLAHAGILEAVLGEVQVEDIGSQRIVLVELLADGGIVLVLLEQRRIHIAEVDIAVHV